MSFIKRYLIAAFLFLVVGLMAVKAGYTCGPNNHLYVETKAGWLWIEGTVSNYGEEIRKQVCAREGNQGSCSAMVDAQVHSVTHRDSRGIFEQQYSEVWACWSYNGYHCSNEF